MQFMYNLLIISMICYTYSRPLQNDEFESEINDLESEDDVEIAADALNDERSKQQEPGNEDSDQNEEMLSENSYQESNADDESSLNTDANLISEHKPGDKSDSNPERYSETNSDEKIGLRSNRVQSNRYIENNDLNQQLEPVENFLNRHVKICKNNPMDNPQNKRTVHTPGDESIKYNNQMNNYDNIHRMNNKDFERSKIFRHYGNENKRIDSEIERNIINRDRRNVQETKRDAEEPSSNKKEYLPKDGSENEELIIRKHIKRLSDTELDELLNSLTEEKRELLKKIISDNNENNAVGDGIDKREITKKAEAVEDNNFIEGAQSDVNKLQSSNPSADMNTESSVSHNTDTTTLTTKTENSEKTDESTTKDVETNSDSENKSDLASRSYEINQAMLDNNFHRNIYSKNKEDVVNNQETAVKIEAKRETNFNNMKNVDTSFDFPKLSENNYYNDKNEPDISFSEDYNICPQYENIAQMNEDEIKSNNVKSHKREAIKKENAIFDSIKALEESFPDTKAIGVTSSNSGPLIRVKRTDLLKRNKSKMLAQVMPEAKIGYYPHRTENIDEDYEEGSEFDNDAFYDRTSNFKSKNKLDNIALNSNFKSDRDINSDIDLISDNLNTVSNNESNEKELTELGSDNDNVLSGVEGANENLMFSSNFRNKRNLDVNLDNIVEDNTPTHSTAVTNNEIRPISN